MNTTGVTIARMLGYKGLSHAEIEAVLAAACGPAKLALGFEWPSAWMRQDHPARVNLILEQLGYEVRL
jgi:hypothetical protein